MIGKRCRGLMAEALTVRRACGDLRKPCCGVSFRATARKLPRDGGQGAGLFTALDTSPRRQPTPCANRVVTYGYVRHGMKRRHKVRGSRSYKLRVVTGPILKTSAHQALFMRA